MQINLRIPEGLAKDLDAIVQDLQTERPGYNLTRTDLIRDVLYRAVQQHKQERQGSRKGKQ